MDKLSAENILKHVNQEDILSYYLGINVIYGKKYTNPLRKDRHADCFFTAGAKYVVFRDYARPEFGGNCFQICALYYGLTLPADFYQVCQRINDDMRIGLDDGYLKDYHPIDREVVQYEREVVAASKIHVRVQPFTELDLKYWDKYCITEEELIKFDCFRANKVWINESVYYFYQEEDLCYAYWFEEEQKFQIYKPMEIRSKKWRTNFTGVDGFKWLPERGKHVFITKSRKDLILLSKFYPSVRVSAEGHDISQEKIDILKSRFENIWVNFDSDDAGVSASVKLTQKYDLRYWNIPKECNTKDVSDFVEAYGLEEMKNLIKSKIGE